MAGIDYNRARELALQVKKGDPSARNVPLDTIIKTIMQAPPESVQTEQGMATPGTTNLGMLFQPPIRTVTPASPAPMQPGIKLQAPKPTTQIVPGGIGGPLETRSLLPDEVRKMAVREARPAPAPAAAPAPAPARTEAPLSDEPVATPKAQFKSRFRPLLESSEYELQQLDLLQQAAAEEEKEVPPEVARKVQILSDRVTQLKSMVAAEEGAAVNADRAAILERQNKRLGREEQLIDEARKRAPGNALIKFGTALASAEKGESFASALARGLQAGSESYTGARESSEDARRKIEERRDALDLQKIDALQKARDEAIGLRDAGYAIDKRTYEMSELTDKDLVNIATRQPRIEGAIAQASTLKTQAEFAPILARAKADLDAAQAWAARHPTRGGGGDGLKPSATVYNSLSSQANSLRKLIGDPYVSKEDKANYRAQLTAIEGTMQQYGRLLGLGSPPPAAPAAPANPARPAGPASLRWDPKLGKLVPNK